MFTALDFSAPSTNAFFAVYFKILVLRICENIKIYTEISEKRRKKDKKETESV